MKIEQAPLVRGLADGWLARLTIKRVSERPHPPQFAATPEVSGKNVLRQWFSYRKLDRTRPIIGNRRPPSRLDRIQTDHWLADYTTDVIDLLHVLGRLVLLEPKQADLLNRMCAGPPLTVDTLTAAGALEAPSVLTM